MSDPPNDVPWPRIARERYLILRWPNGNELARQIEDAQAFIRGFRVMSAPSTVEIAGDAADLAAVIRYAGPAIEAHYETRENDKPTRARIHELTVTQGLRVFVGISFFRRGLDHARRPYDLDHLILLGYDDEAFQSFVRPAEAEEVAPCLTASSS